MDETRTMLVEFLTVAGLVTLAGLGLVVLAITGADSDSAAASTLADTIKVLGGALVALAYAARGVRRNGS